MRSRRLVQIARKDIIWLLAGLLGLQLGLAVAMEFGLPELRDPPYGYRIGRLVTRLKAPQPRPIVLMLGSSRTAYGLRASRIEEQLGGSAVVFNFGVHGAGPVMQQITLQRLLARGVKPDLLLLEVIPAFLTEQAPPEIRWINPTRLYQDELAILERYGAPQRELARAWCRAWPVPWYSHRFAIVSRFAPSWLPFQLREDSWRSADDSGSPEPFRKSVFTPAQRQRALESARQTFACCFSDFHIGGVPLQASRDLLEQCRREQIPTALVMLPESAAYRSWYPPAVWGQVQSFIGDLGREFGVQVIDARAWVADDGFVDCHHLAANGGAVFSERLGREVIQPWLRTFGKNKSRDR